MRSTVRISWLLLGCLIVAWSSPRPSTRTTDRRSGAPRDVQPAPGCATVLADYPDAAYKGRRFPMGGPNVWGRSLKNVDDASLPSGKWVGVVWRQKSDDAAKNPAPPFGALAPGDSGCLHFRDTGAEATDGGFQAEAFLYRPDPDARRIALSGIVCYEGSHGHGNPSWMTAAKRCKKARRATVFLNSGAGETRVIPVVIDKKKGFKRSLAAALDSATGDPQLMGFSTSLAAARATLSTAGPWFPCASNGCCRAF